MPSALLLQGELPEWAEDHIRAQWAEIKRLKAEVERLRAALRAILDDPEIGTNVALYAKTALGDDDGYR